MATTNNALNNQSSTSIASEVKTFTVSNSNNTGSSAAKVNISVGGGTTTGDPQTSYVVTGAQTWSVGVDNSVSDQFVIASSATLGTNNAETIDTSGRVQWPLQPAFLAYLATSDTNATGDGTVYTFGGGNALTEVFDKASNFNTNGTFTAPITGQYYLSGNIEISACTINTGLEIQIVTTARTYSNRFNRVAAATTFGLSLCTLADMTAGDTAILKAVGYGEAGATETITGSAGGLINYFSGYLMG